jgi:GNAT superfamily N-acetyltransferase
MIMLQPAIEADLEDVAALTNWAYRGMGDQSSWTVESYLEGERTTVEALQDDLASKPHGRLLIWRAPSGELLGHFWLEPLGSDTWYIGLLSVRPDRQDQKLGRSLLEAAEDVARQARARRMQMTVINVRDTLIAWYQRRGYLLTGETRPFPYGDDRFGRPLREDLHFVVLEREL